MCDFEFEHECEFAYALEGDDFAAAGPGCPRGLPLPDRYAGPDGVPEADADAAAVLCAEGDSIAEEAEADGGGKSEPNDGLSWGAGEGAIVMAVIMSKRNVYFLARLSRFPSKMGVWRSGV